MTLLAQRLAVAIGARIRELRVERGMTQQQLADRLGSHRPLVGRIECGRHEPSLEVVAAYADALRVDLFEIAHVVDDVVDTTTGALASNEDRAAAAHQPDRRTPRHRRSRARAAAVLDHWNAKRGAA